MCRDNFPSKLMSRFEAKSIPKYADAEFHDKSGCHFHCRCTNYRCDIILSAKLSMLCFARVEKHQVRRY
jgi:hypothetical protein